MHFAQSGLSGSTSLVIKLTDNGQDTPAINKQAMDDFIRLYAIHADNAIRVDTHTTSRFALLLALLIALVPILWFAGGKVNRAITK